MPIKDLFAASSGVLPQLLKFYTTLLHSEGRCWPCCERAVKRRVWPSALQHEWFGKGGT